jgi:hypothetical protein
MRNSLIEKIAVTFELCGGVVLSDPAKAAIVSDLCRYTEKQVSDALDRCRNECRRLTQQDIISRIDDGRPGPQEAWGMIPTSEEASVVWTEEMAEAYGTIRFMDDPVAARMAFIESYNAAILRSRAQGAPVKWSPSLGSDPHGRDRSLIEAAEKGRLRGESAMRLMSRPEEMPVHLLPEDCRPNALPTSAGERQEKVTKLETPMSVADILKAAGLR